MAFFTQVHTSLSIQRFALALGLAGMLSLAACSAPVPLPPVDQPPPVATSCHAGAALAAVKGKRPTPAVQQEALRAAGAQTVRTLHKNDIVTMEYMEGRLNLITNDAGLVETARCG